MASVVEDELEIRGLLARYADAVNRRDEVAWAATWSEKAVWEVLGRTLRGRDAVVATWRELMSGLPFVFHVVHNGVVELDGDRALGRFAVSELGQLPGGTSFRLLGLYHDRFGRDSEGWRFAGRRLEVLYQGPPDLTGALPGA